MGPANGMHQGLDNLLLICIVGSGELFSLKFISFEQYINKYKATLYKRKGKPSLRIDNESVWSISATGASYLLLSENGEK